MVGSVEDVSRRSKGRRGVDSSDSGQFLRPTTALFRIEFFHTDLSLSLPCFSPQSSIVDAYRPFHDLVRAEYTFAVSGVVLSPLKMWDFLRTVVLEEEEESDLLERV